ncbi:hypothetical protein LOC67_08285 [Stieleria sp. JC731]|uniref:hypothetical protein n=1 Tax=Pirellulaceae TaxID=2691357 RepID=UPI001E38CC34|nr:hypothetical protein [Stieleria sp. JC731]MCC9600556.1 hypothetical protein [Stieleria sp. JC731]
MSDAILSKIQELFGVEKYNSLVRQVSETKRRQKFKYWQEDLFKKLAANSEFKIISVDEYVAAFEHAPTANLEITREQFLADPCSFWMKPVTIPDDWFVEAWDSDEQFRGNQSAEYIDEASANGDLKCMRDGLKRLAKLLPIERSIELYCAVRDESPHREPEYRPTFKKVFGKDFDSFPDPIDQVRFLICDSCQMADVSFTVPGSTENSLTPPDSKCPNCGGSRSDCTAEFT